MRVAAADVALAARRLGDVESEGKVPLPERSPILTR